LLLFVFELFDFSFYVIVIVLRLLILRIELQGLLVVIECIGPVAELFVVTFLCFAALIKGVAKIIMSFALKTGIPREQRLAKRFHRLAVIFQFVGGCA